MKNNIGTYFFMVFLVVNFGSTHAGPFDNITQSPTLIAFAVNASVGMGNGVLQAMVGSSIALQKIYPIASKLLPTTYVLNNAVWQQSMLGGRNMLALGIPFALFKGWMGNCMQEQLVSTSVPETQREIRNSFAGRNFLFDAFQVTVLCGFMLYAGAPFSACALHSVLPLAVGGIRCWRNWQSYGYSKIEEEKIEKEDFEYEIIK
jgi:hypothetical protein